MLDVKFAFGSQLLKICNLLTVLLFIFFVSDAATAQVKATEPAEPQTTTTTVVTINGQQIKINAQTGRLLRPLTAEEAQVLADGMKESLSKSTEGLVITKYADGTEEMDLEGRFQSLTIGRTNADGRVETECVGTPQAANAFFGIELVETATPKDIKDASPATKTAPQMLSGNNDFTNTKETANNQNGKRKTASVKPSRARAN